MSDYRIRTVIATAVGLAPITVLFLVSQPAGALTSAGCAVAWPLCLAWTTPAARRERKNWKWQLLLAPIVYWPATVAFWVFLSWHLGGHRP